jgi:hypothetical protein
MCTHGGQEFVLLSLRHTEMIEREADFLSYPVELFGRDVQVLVRVVHVLAGVLKQSRE